MAGPSLQSTVRLTHCSMYWFVWTNDTTSGGDSTPMRGLNVVDKTPEGIKESKNYNNS